ncbi:hypothetical protein [Pseudonocardia zijingensis]
MTIPVSRTYVRASIFAATAEVHHSPAVPLAALVSAIEDAGDTAERSRR